MYIYICMDACIKLYICMYVYMCIFMFIYIAISTFTLSLIIGTNCTFLTLIQLRPMSLVVCLVSPSPFIWNVYQLALLCLLNQLW